MSEPDWGCDVNQPDQHAVYVISVAAELAGVHPQTLRIYERKGLINPARTAGRSRRYSEADIAALRRIQELTTAGVGLPGVARILPRPGAWMSAFRQAMAFPVYATTCWLLWVLARQAGPDGLALGLALAVPLLAAALFQCLAAWLLIGREGSRGGEFAAAGGAPAALPELEDTLSAEALGPGAATQCFQDYRALWRTVIERRL